MKKYEFDPVQRAIIERSCVPVAVYQFLDKRVVTIALSAGFCKLFGYTPEEAYRIMDNNMYKDAHPDDVARVSDAAYRFSTEGGQLNVAYRTRKPEGYRIIHARGEHVFTETGERLAYVWYADEGGYVTGEDPFEDELNHAFNNVLREQTLYRRSNFDHLTGLPTMTHFFELAEAGRMRLLDDGKTPAFLFFNLNGMKFFNHKHGFAEGDKLIGAVADILKTHFGNANCGRFSKDHFAAIAGTDNLEATLRDVLGECKTANGGNSLPVRVGIYLDETDGVSVSEACDKAQYACNLDRGTYESGFHYFKPEMMASAENRRYIVENIDRAIEERWIQVYYQAIVRSANGKVCDEEALARWIDPVKGMLSPADFIPALEDANLAYKLDLHIVDQVLEKMKRQAAAGLYVVPQSVNLSRTDFEALDIVEEIRQRVDAARISREKLTIEITESVVGSDFEFMKGQIARFRELGFKVWMDDFGSGYSSLDVLQSVHFDMIKLDMRFLEDFDKGDESKIILTELVNMAIGLGIDTVAEGVETEEQAGFLREIGCSRLQGFYYTKPIPLDTIFERNEQGLQIGFENPDEADYYATIGKVNLYDMAVIAQDSDPSLKRYFDTIPMAIYEVNGDDYRVTRSNRTYRDYLERAFGVVLVDDNHRLPIRDDGRGSLFLETLRQCSLDGNLVVLDEDTAANETTHSIIKRIAVNPVTGTAALVVAVLAVIDSENHRAAVTYAHIAKALSSDYRYLYYINLDTEEFIEYSTDGANNDLSVERRGGDFFQASRTDALTLLHEPDQEAFIAAFTKENVIGQMDANGAFIVTYRMLFDGEPRWLLMKAVRMDEDDNHIIIGVSDIDARMKQREELERIKAERDAYINGE